jgi:hypothetical protein
MNNDGVVKTAAESKSRRGGIMHALVLSVDSPRMFEHFYHVHHDVLKLLHNDRDIKGRTPLHHIALYPTNMSLSYLIHLGFNFDTMDDFGRTFLHLLCRNANARLNFSCWDTVFELSTPGIINHSDHAGRTCLHYINNPDIALRLINIGGDFDKPDHQGNTPIYRASPTVQALFLTLGASQIHQDGIGRSPLSYLFDRYNQHLEDWSTVKQFILHGQTNHAIRHGYLGCTTLHYLILGEEWLNLDFYRQLLDPPRSVNPHATTNDGYCVMTLIMKEFHEHGPYSAEIELQVLNILFLISKYRVATTGYVNFQATT